MMLIKNLMRLSSITAIALAILGVNLPVNTANAQTTVQEKPNIEIDAALVNKSMILKIVSFVFYLKG